MLQGLTQLLPIWAPPCECGVGMSQDLQRGLGGGAGVLMAAGSQLRNCNSPGSATPNAQPNAHSPNDHLQCSSHPKPVSQVARTNPQAQHGLREAVNEATLRPALPWTRHNFHPKAVCPIRWSWDMVPPEPPVSSPAGTQVVGPADGRVGPGRRGVPVLRGGLPHAHQLQGLQPVSQVGTPIPLAGFKAQSVLSAGG